jgi:hypothetical protein
VRVLGDAEDWSEENKLSRERTVMGSSALCLQLLSNQIKTAASGWRRVADELQSALDLPDDVLLAERPASTFILTWMRQLRAFHIEFGSLFGRKKLPPLADDFTAAVALCLEQFLAARGHSDRVRSEETTHKKRGATRPDVSVLSTAGALVATVECKTNLGWKRKKWREQCESRNAALLARFPDATSYLCVLTQKNWNVEEFLNSPFYGKRWFCLSKVSVGKITDPVNDILFPIEPMFLAILERLRVLTTHERGG